VRRLPFIISLICLSIGIISLFLLTRANVVLIGLEQFSEMTISTQFWLFCAAVLFTTLGMGGIPRFKLDPFNTKEFRQELLIIGLIGLLALMLRAVWLEDAVHLFVLDEFWFTEGVNRFQRDPLTPLLQPFMDPTPYTGIFPMMQRVMVDLFGATLASVRLPSVLFGVGTVLTTYWLGRELFSRRVAVIGALLLTVFPPHIHFSRLGINNIADPFFGVLALACLTRGLLHDDGHRFTWALGGCALGLTYYFYDAGKLIFTPMMIAWLVCLLIGKRLRRKHIVPLLIFGITAALVAFPTLHTSAVRGFSFSLRMEQMGWGFGFLTLFAPLVPQGHPEIIAQYFEVYIFPVMQHYVITTDSAPYFYGGQTAMLLPPMAILFVVALLYCLWKWRDARHQLLLLWILLTTLGISLVYPPTWTIRYPVIFPAFMLMIAVLGERIDFRFPRARPLWSTLFVVLLISQPMYYFGVHLPFYNEQARPQSDYVDAMFRAAQFPRRADIYFISDEIVDLPNTWMLQGFWSMEGEIFHQPTLSEAELRALPRDVDLIIFVGQSDIETQNDIQAAFPNAQPLLSPYNMPLHRQYVMFYIPAESSP
jgi:4-amino-4-deoxy-L-arabinose transferase-like glycosyltransferase